MFPLSGLAMDPKADSQRVFQEKTVLYSWADGLSDEMQEKCALSTT